MKKIAATVFALLLTGAAYAESVPAKLLDQFNDTAVRTERNSVGAASENALRIQREATERANREMLERQNREAYERAQREAAERAQRETQQRAAEQQRVTLEQTRQRQLSAAQDFNHVAPPPVHREWNNNLGGTSTYTNKPTTDPNFPGHRFESTQTRDASGDKVFKETIIRDSAGDVKAVK